MNHKHIVALLLAATTVFAVGCQKEEGNGDAPKERVSRLYLTSHSKVESYNSATGTWNTLVDHTTERKLMCEFFWSGDRLDSLWENALPRPITIPFSYDDAGHLVQDAHGNLFIDFFYDADGRLSRTYHYTLDSVGDTTCKQNIVYTLVGGRREQAECSVWFPDATGTSVVYSLHRYFWSGDNVDSVARRSLYANGGGDTTCYRFEYTDIPNPFCGMTFLQTDAMGMIWSFDGLDGLNRNLPKRVTDNKKGEYKYEYTTSGGRVSTVSEHSFNDTSANNSMRYTSEAFYEIEYLP